MAAIYKKGQGYWTRLMSAIALGTLVLMGSVWVWDILNGVIISESLWDQPVYTQAVGAVLFAGFFGFLGYQFIGRKPKIVDFMIATEGEMKKVNWSSRREILGSTWVVIGLTIAIALLCFVFDQLFILLFRAVGVLETGG
jgi:preprotein translocase SecE subunit